MEITNTGSRAFIVKKTSVIDGGELDEKRDEIHINPGQTVDVTEECGKFLSKYTDIRVIKKGKKVEK